MQLNRNFNYLGGLQKPSFAKVFQTLGKPHFWSQIAVLPGSHKCPALAVDWPPERLQIMCFAKFHLPGASQTPTKAQFCKSIQSPSETKLFEPSRCFTWFPQVPRPCRRPSSRAPPNHVFDEVSALGASHGGLQKPSFARVPKPFLLEPNRCFT